MLPATSRADHSSRRRAPRCEETHALPLFFSALSYAVAARLDSPGSALFESCEAFHAPSHPLPLRRNHDFARPLRRVPTPDPDLEPWWLSRPPIPVGPQQARSSQLAARSPQPTATLSSPSTGRPVRQLRRGNSITLRPPSPFARRSTSSTCPTQHTTPHYAPSIISRARSAHHRPPPLPSSVSLTCSWRMGDRAQRLNTPHGPIMISMQRSLSSPVAVHSSPRRLQDETPSPRL